MTEIVILSGVSGSGKSTVAIELALVAELSGKKSQICSADQYFETVNGYKFDRTKLGDAHSFCFGSFLAAIQRGVEMIIVDNTNTSATELNPYMLGASAYGIKAKIITLICD